MNEIIQILVGAIYGCLIFAGFLTVVIYLAIRAFHWADEYENKIIDRDTKNLTKPN